MQESGLIVFNYDLLIRNDLQILISICIRIFLVLFGLIDQAVLKGIVNHMDPIGSVKIAKVPLHI